MITVDIDGAQVPVNMIKSWSLREEEKYFGGQTSTLQIEYYSNNRCHHHITITGQDALDVFNALEEACIKQEQLTSLEVELDSIERALKDLEEEYRNKKVEKYNLRNAIYALTKV